jgi:hypothetical protein
MRIVTITYNPYTMVLVHKLCSEHIPLFCIDFPSFGLIDTTQTPSEQVFMRISSATDHVP